MELVLAAGTLAFGKLGISALRLCEKAIKMGKDMRNASNEVLDLANTLQLFADTLLNIDQTMEDVQRIVTFNDIESNLQKAQHSNAKCVLSRFDNILDGLEPLLIDNKYSTLVARIAKFRSRYDWARMWSRIEAMRLLLVSSKCDLVIMVTTANIKALVKVAKGPSGSGKRDRWFFDRLYGYFYKDSMKVTDHIC